MSTVLRYIVFYFFLQKDLAEDLPAFMDHAVAQKQKRSASATGTTRENHVTSSSKLAVTETKSAYVKKVSRKLTTALPVCL